MLAKGTPLFIILFPVLLLVTLVMWYGSGPSWASPYLPLLVVLAPLTFLVLYFFRDPDRPLAEGLVAPAHGRVLGVDAEDGRTRVSIFMSPFDVHVARAPLDGKVVSMERSGSGFHRADSPEAGHNVQLEIGLQGDGEPFTVVLVSGWFARRIVPYIGVGDTVARGSRIGLIRFGSRVDVLVPEGSYTIGVRQGAKVRAATTSLGVRR
jgi:phosphatidylserine decarboxylase